MPSSSSINEVWVDGGDYPEYLDGECWVELWLGSSQLGGSGTKFCHIEDFWGSGNEGHEVGDEFVINSPVTIHSGDLLQASIFTHGITEPLATFEADPAVSDHLLNGTWTLALGVDGNNAYLNVDGIIFGASGGGQATLPYPRIRIS